MNKPIYKLHDWISDWINNNKLQFSALCNNEHLKAIEILRKNQKKINWHILSGNSEAIELLLENPNKIDWHFLSVNKSDKAIELLKNNTNKINWRGLSNNTNKFS
jgi:hypothetical protein